MATYVEPTRVVALRLFTLCRVLTSRSLVAATGVSRQGASQLLVRLVREGTCTRTKRRNMYHYRMVGHE